MLTYPRAALLVGAIVAHGIASGVGAQSRVPLRTTKIVAATDSGVLHRIAQVRPLSAGAVIVNDWQSLRLVMLDSSLANARVLADSAAGAPNPYSVGPSGLIAYPGDSTIFVDRTAQALIMIAPDGRFVRVLAPPSTADMIRLLAVDRVVAFADPQGRLVYRSQRPSQPDSRPEPTRDGEYRITARSDSAPIVRGDFRTRMIDTAAMLKIPVPRTLMMRWAGGMVGAQAFNPLPTTDDWTLLPDGTIAIVRAFDYHIDWISMDGTVTSSPKMPFDWKRITLEEKEQLLDSVRAAMEARRAQEPPRPPPPPGSIRPPPTPITLAEPSDLADYYPPVRAGYMYADTDGNVWLLPSTVTQSEGGLVYDVINRRGVLVERVKLPEGRNVAGFGPNGALYLIHAPTPARVTLKKRAVVVRD